MKKVSCIIFLILILMTSCVKEILQIIDQEENGVFFYEKLLYKHDNNSDTYWRIPALLQLSDGSLIAINDKRNHNNGLDLPGDIDIVFKKSTDNGRSWSEFRYLAKNPKGTGYGDAAIVETLDGRLVCVFVGDNGTLDTTPDCPINSYVYKSRDMGESWEEHKKITDLIMSINKRGEEEYISSFFASGNGLCIKEGPYRGRIMFAAALFRKAKESDLYYLEENGTLYAMDNYIVYSDDEGDTWKVSEKAFCAGDEAKLVELKDGKILLSVRQQGARGYNISEDGGEKWGNQGYWAEMNTNACNGDIIRFNYHDGLQIKTCLLHSLTNSKDRSNVSIFISTDEGKSWNSPISIYKGPSHYSSMTVLKDGSIGLYLEKDKGTIELWYLNFSYEWLKEHISDK